MMLNRYIFSILLACLLISVRCEDEDLQDEESEVTTSEVKETSEPLKENGVYVLTDNNFDDFIIEKNLVLLEFYAPWCGHCKSFAPTYEKIAQALEGKVPVAKIDATVSKDLAQRYSIQGYPTIKILKDGEAVDYKGARTEDSIVNKINEISDPNWKPPPEAVITLTSDDFDSTVDNADIILVEFYAPWCGHCRKLAPEYEAAAQKLKAEDPPIPLAKVDATAEGDLATRFGVSGYPTLKLFRRGRAYEYDGGRDEKSIISYMIEQSKPPSTAINTVKTMRNLLHYASDVTIIACFTGQDDPALEVFQNAGNSLRSEYEFHHTFNSDVMSYVGASVGEIILFHPERFHSKFEKKSYKHSINKDTTKDDLEEFYGAHAVPLVGQRTRDNMKKRYKKRPLVVVYYDVDFGFDYRVATQLWRSKVLQVASSLKDITFAIANEDDFGEELKKVGLEDSPEEINVVIYDDKDRKFPMPPNDEFDAEVLTEFVEEFKAGSLKPKYKSASKPKKNKGLVKVVVADTFNDNVMDKSKDVLIEFYAPWCGHCKKLEPVYKKVGKHYKDDSSLVIAKMDATANDVPHSAYNVEGFPTIYWAPADAKDSPTKFDGRSYDDFIEFIDKQRKTGAKDEL